MIKKIIMIIIIIIVCFLYKIKNTLTSYLSFYFNKYLLKDKLKYPKHVAFIMDGNGRWATEKNMNRTHGHLMGSVNLLSIIYCCFLNGSDYLTFYAFSEENWKRPKKETDYIFEIIYKKLKFMSKLKEDMSFKIMIQGRRDRIPNKLLKLINLIEKNTQPNNKTIIIALDYSGRSEILHACKQLLKNNLEPTINNFTNYLYVANVPDPDLIIRTSGEKRMSDFLTWQHSYSELYFTDVKWPDFTVQELEKAIINYNTRQRRYGDIK
jgi:undecaprenyl diphosphate synthase